MFVVMYSKVQLQCHALFSNTNGLVAHDLPNNYVTMFVSDVLAGWEVPPELKQEKKLNLGPKDAIMLMRMRACYITQLFLTVTNASAKNMENLYAKLNAQQTLLDLADLDGCLLSFESMSNGWLHAFTELCVTGSFGVKSAIQAINMKPVTEGAKNLFNEKELLQFASCTTKASAVTGSASGSSGGDAMAEDGREAIFKWGDLLEFGSSETQPHAPKVLDVQLDLQLQILRAASNTEAAWKDRLVVHVVSPDDDATGRASKQTTYDLLLHIPQKEELVQSPKDEKILLYKIPASFKLVFWGSIGNSTASLNRLERQTLLNVFILRLYGMSILYIYYHDPNPNLLDWQIYDL